MATKTLPKLKSEMVFNQDLARLVDVMKGIAAAQYQMMERKRTNLERRSKTIEDLFRLYDFRLEKHPFICAVKPPKLICLVTTDSGFLGGLNMKVAQAGIKYEDEGSQYLVIGERGVNYMREFGRTCIPYPGINPDESRFDLAQKVRDKIFSLIKEKKVGRVILIHPFPVSFAAQRIEILNLIPCPLFFKERTREVRLPEAQAKGVILESGARGVIEYLTRLWLDKRLIEIFEQSKLAEFGARTMHLEESYQTLSKLNQRLKLSFFKARREKIDQSLRESFTSQLMCGEEES